MTIRLTCTQCKRKLKVPDEALDKKIQCPSCGARFVGRIEPSPSATAPQPSEASSPIVPVTAGIPSAETHVVDLLFAEMAQTPLEGSASLMSPVPTLELGQLPIPEATATGAIVDPIVPEMEEMYVIEAEQPPARDGKAVGARKGSRTGMRIGCLMVGLSAMILIFGGGGYAIYRWIKTDISEDNWKVFAVPDSQCTVLMPGIPEWTTTGDPRTQMYQLVRPEEQIAFRIRYQELEPVASPKVEEILKAEIDKQKRDLGGTEISQRAIQVGMARGYEFQVRASNGDLSMTRLFLVPDSSGPRVYQAIVSGPRVQPGPGDATKFLNSLFINITPPIIGPAGMPKMAAPPAANPEKDRKLPTS